jgi:thiamine-phosphate pyrophosphorylase
LTDFNRTQLYLITPPKLDLAIFPSILERTLDTGHVACIQLRLKDAIEEDLRQAIDILRPITQDRGVTFLLNDDPAMAADTGCDGVHIGQEDATYGDAREAIGPNAIVGVTCHASRHLGMDAAEQGADYVAFGAFFETKTKKTKFHANLEILEWWCQDMTVPSVAIGGITLDNCRPLIGTGVDFLAIASGVWDYAKGPDEAVKAFNQVIEETTLN